ncbi:MAG: ATP-binding protein [Desulfoplanes sp.]
MKISSKIKTIYTLIALEHIFIIFIYSYYIEKMDNATDNDRLVYSIVKDVSDITVLIDGLNPINRQRIIFQWDIKNKKIRDTVEKIAIYFKKDESVLQRMLIDMEKINELIHDNDKKKVSTIKEDDFTIFKNNIFSNILVILENVSSSSNTLLKKSHANITTLEARCKHMVIIVMIIFILSMLCICFFLHESIVSPLCLLLKKMEKIGKGKLKYTPEYHSQDEIGDFSRAFDAMTSKLCAITVSRDKLIEEVNTRKTIEKELQRNEKTLKALSSKMMSAMEEERKRIGCEIHDSVVQDLIALKLRQENAIISLERKKQGIDLRLLDENIASIQKIIVLLREIIMGLRPSILDDLGLASALQWYCREFAKAYGQYRFEINITEPAISIPDDLATAIFRITQEALKNIVKHSEATVITVILSCRANILEIWIQDNGKGFNADDESYKLLGMGISGMRERVEAASGVFLFHAVENKGVTVRALFTL